MNKIMHHGKFLLLFLIADLVSAQNYGIDSNPERIILNMTDRPSSSIAVTWRTNKEYPESKIQFVQASDWIINKDSVKTIAAIMKRVVLDSSKAAFHYSGLISELKPDNIYNYRVGHDSIWSEWNQFRTAENREAPFTFLFFGDPQNDLKQYCTRIFREAYKNAPSADFWLFAGDLIGAPQYDSLWSDLFYSYSFMPRTIPFAMVPGNHEYPSLKIDGVIKKELIPFWRAHFTLPENGVEGLEETSFCFEYQNTLFIMLNGNQKLNEQSEWMKKILDKNSSKWVIVVMHQTLYPTGRERDGEQYREAFLKIYDKYGVDLVLQGHDHNYARSYKLYGGNIVPDDKKGTIYVTSVSGPKAYKLTSKYPELMRKTGENIQLYQVISIDKGKLSFKSYTATGSLYDSFDIYK